MSILVDREIRELCKYHEEPYNPTREEYAKWKALPPPMIEPFSEAVSGNDIISYGLTSAGFDLRLAPDVLVLKNTHGEAIDPKRFKDEAYRDKVFDAITYSGPVIIPAHGYILGRCLEYIRMPRNLKGRVIGKSTLARCAIVINCTPIEPQWEGHITLEISNAGPLPAVVYVNEGIAQLEFEQLTGVPDWTYADKKGKYQGSKGVTPAIVK